MQDFHYTHIKNKHDVKAEMLLTNTDSLKYEIEAKKVYEDFHEDKELFDFNNYPKDSKYYNNPNNLVVSKIKDEKYSVPLK